MKLPSSDNSSQSSSIALADKDKIFLNDYELAKK